jgi:hypothetical protein
MEFTDIHKLVLNAITVIAWAMGIVISVVAAIKGNKMKEDMGVSAKIYFMLVGITEIFYTIGAAMILSAMGINVFQHLAKLEIWKFYQVVSSLDVSTIRIIGIVGWIGFLINRSMSFVTPAYLLVAGGKKLHRYFFWSAWTEISLETMMTVLLFTTLNIK